LVIADQEVPPIVFEQDDTHVKAGFADEDVPRTISAAVAGSYYPMDRGYIKEISHAEIIWNDVFNYKLDADPARHGVMFTEPCLNSLVNVKKIGTSMFETYSAPYIATAPGPVMALYASGRSTGLSFSVGGGIAQCIPIVDGYPITKIGQDGYVQNVIPFGGKDVTRFLGRSLMPHRGSWLHSMAEQEIVANCLEQTCFVPDTPTKYDEFLHDPVESQATYTMPDGMELQIGFERFKAGEAMFRPELGLLPKVDGEYVSMSDLAWNTIQQVHSANHPILLNDIVLSGSLSLTKGFSTRLAHELTEIAKYQGVSHPLRVVAKPERKYLEWIGASITATLSSFSQNWILASEYEECGPSIMERKGMFPDLRRDEMSAIMDWEKDPIVAAPKTLVAADETLSRNATMENMMLWRSAIEGAAETCLQALERDNCEMNAGDPSNEGMTALHFASRYGNSDVVHILVAAGCDVAAKDDYGKTALHWAAANDKSEEAVKELLAAPETNVNAQDRLGRTPLHYATSAGNKIIAELLVAGGADLTATERNFRTPEDFANGDALSGIA